MQQLEPTYLRYVYDGLSKGSISSNNPTSLPIGFIGLFEDEFPSSMPLVERMSIINRLATWALLKGPVSIEMVAEILNEHPDNTKALIDTYSKWFNSPEPGKYVLYHDRLRTYLLQKLSNHEVQDLNETLISYLENALSSEGLKEAESYALEHLSTHMAVESQMGDNYERLHEFVNQEDLWKRQITTSNEYKWSQRAVQYGIKEGARRHDENNSLKSSINYLQLIKLEIEGHKEIFILIKNKEYDLVINRLNGLDDYFKFKLCILILFESFLGSLTNIEIDINFVSDIVGELRKIKADDKNFITWADFFSEILMYNIHLELNKNNIDILFLWIDEKIDFKKIINHDYNNLFSEGMWFNCLAQIISTKSEPQILFLAFKELIKLKLKIGYDDELKENIESLSYSLIQISDNDNKLLIEKYLKSYHEIFISIESRTTRLNSLKNLLFKKLFEKLNRNDQLKKIINEYNYLVRKAHELECLDEFLKNCCEVEFMTFNSLSSSKLDVYQQIKLQDEISNILFSIKCYENSFRLFEESKFSIKYLNITEDSDFNKIVKKKCIDYITEFISLKKHKSVEDVLQLLFSINGKDNFKTYFNQLQQLLIKKFNLKKSSYSIVETFNLFTKVQSTNNLVFFNTIVAKELTYKLESEINYEIDLGHGDLNENGEYEPYLEPRGQVLKTLSDYFVDCDDVEYAIKIINLFDHGKEYTYYDLISSIIYVMKNLYSNIEYEKTYSKVDEFIHSQSSQSCINLNKSLLEQLIVFKSESKKNISDNLSFFLINNQIEKFIEYNFCQYESEFDKYVIDNRLINNLDNDSSSEILYDLVSSLPGDYGVIAETYAFGVADFFIKQKILNPVKEIISKLNSRLYKYFVTMILIKSLINEGRVDEALVIAKDFEGIIFKKNLLLICYFYCKSLEKDNYSIKIINDLISIVQLEYSRNLICNSIFGMLNYFQDETDINYFKNNIIKYNYENIFINSNEYHCEYVSLFIIDEERSNYDFKNNHFERPNYDNSNQNINQVNLHDSLKNFQIDLYSSQPEDNMVKNGVEILLHYYKIGDNENSYLFQKKLIDYLFYEKSGWCYHSNIIRKIIETIIECNLSNLFNLRFLCDLGLLIEDDEIRSKTLFAVFEIYPNEFNLFKEIEKDEVIRFCFSSACKLNNEEIFNIIKQLKKLSLNNVIKIINESNFYFLQLKELLKFIDESNKKTVLKNIFEREFLNLKKINHNIFLDSKTLENSLVGNKKDFFSNQINFPEIDFSLFNKLRKKLNPFFTGSLKVDLISRIILNENISDYKSFITEHYQLSEYNISLSKIAIKLAELGSYEKSVIILNMMQDDQPNWIVSDGGDDNGILDDVLKTNTSEKISKILIRKGEINESLKIVNTIQHTRNRLFLVNDLIVLFVKYSITNNIFNKSDFEKLIESKSSALKYDYNSLDEDLQILKQKISFKVFDEIFNFYELNTPNGLNKVIIEYLNFIFTNLEELINNYKIAKNLDIGHDEDYLYLFNLSKLISIHELVNFVDKKISLKFNQFIQTFVKFYRRLLEIENLYNPFNKTVLFADISFKLYVYHNKISVDLSKEFMDNIISNLSLALKSKEENIFFKSFDFDSGIERFNNKSEAINYVSIQILKYLIRQDNHDYFFNLMGRFYINEQNENLVILNKRKFLRLERIKRLKEINAPEVILLNEQKLIDEVISGIISIKCEILNKLKNYKSSKLYHEIIEELIDEGSSVDNIDIKSSNNFQLAKLLVNLNNENDYYFSKLLEIFRVLKYQDYQKICSYSLGILPLNKVIPLLKIDRQVFDNEEFISKNIKKFEKYFEIDNYSFLSNFHSNQNICNYFVSNSFKIKFNSNKELSLFDKLFETKLYQELNDIISDRGKVS